MRLDRLIVERLTSVSRDVDMIYTQYFRDAFNYVKKTGKVDSSLLLRARVSSDVLRSGMSKKANKLNPVYIVINDGTDNSYHPKVPRRIRLNVHTEAWSLAKQAGGVTLAASMLVDHLRDMFLLEFEPHRMKGTIHHELNHWIDDSLNNTHIQQYMDKASASGRSVQDNQGPIERNSQIHNIVQLKRHLKGEWDTLSFNEMIKMIPILMVVRDKLSPGEFQKWKRNLLKRMAREGLLGAGMRRAA